MNQRNANRQGPAEQKHLWGVLLAGGDGKRLQSFIRSIYGYDRPKQFCSILGGKTMLQHTLDRARKIIPSERILAIVNQKHLQFAKEDLADQPVENIITQPGNCETGPGILLPLLHVEHRDPEATVILFPSDHFIYEGDRFMEYVRDAAEFVKQYTEMLVVLGIQPDHPEPGYGWIEAKEGLGRVHNKLLFKVKRFWEKPNVDTMRQLFQRGCMWNTMLTVGKVSTFMSLFEKYAPEIYHPFTRIREAIGTPHEDQVIRKVFRQVPAVNFSHTVLEQSAEHLGVVRVQNVYWSDWGDQNRIMSDVERFGFLPNDRKERLIHAVSH